jgi:eukaryotic-like serine/threonine-protein kinase
MSQSASQAETGQIGRYVDLTLLGQGGMGAVYRGRDPELDRPVAVKVMLDATPDFVARFRREAQAIARLVHPNIIQVYDFGVDDRSCPYFVMELVDGQALDRIIRDRGRLPPLEAIRLIRQAAEGLTAAHRAGIVHRDIKPSNLIVDGKGHVKLVDFGIARVTTNAGTALTGAAALMGTPGYMAPEQAQGKPVDHRADIYALGLTLYELLSGQPPYTAADPISLVVKNMQEPLPDLRVRGFGLPDELVVLVEQMGAKDPGERLQSCEAVVAALDDIASRLSASPSPGAYADTDRIPPTNVKGKAIAPPPDTAAQSKSKAGLIIGGAAGVLAIAVGAVFFLTRPPATPVVIKDNKPIENRDVNVTVKTPPPEVKPAGNNAVQGRPGQGKAEGPLRVAVFKFKNVGSDDSLKQLESGIGETAVTEMQGASKKVALIDRQDIESDITEIDRAGDFHFDAVSVAKLGELKGVEVAVQGGFQKAGNKLRITARFVRVETGEVLDTLSVTRNVKDVFKAQDEVAGSLRDKLVALAAKEGNR